MPFKIMCLVARTLVLATGVGFTSAKSASPPLLWTDEFNQPVGSVPDPSHWSFDLGGTGWGNRELQIYTNSPENASIVRDSDATDGKALAIRAVKSRDGRYTSARLKTQGKFSLCYGRIEARLKMPNGRGIWPAFWMLSTGVTKVGWPACGEVDVAEAINANPNIVYGTLHGPGYSGGHALQGSTKLLSGTLDQAYHVYAVDWSVDKISWSFDGAVYYVANPTSLPPGSRWVFNDNAFFLLLNLAVGGDWPGNPQADTPFPQTYSIDYIRVYGQPTSVQSKASRTNADPTK